MASFSFRAGNAGKLMRIPLYLAGRLGTLIVPRGRGWVIGCGAGIGDGALALWRVATQAGENPLWLTGSAREEREAAALGIRSIPKGGLRGWWATARAGVVVVTHGFGDVNRYATSGAFLVQLWHGIPLKRIGLDSPATVQSAILPRFVPLQRLIGALYRGQTRRIRILPAASDRSRGRLESAFGLGVEQVLVTGEPRVDVLSAGEPGERRDRARRLLEAAVGPVPEGARVLLYAPTWRDGAADPAVPGAAEWERIVAMLERTDAVLLVRSHPLGEGDYRPTAETARIRTIGSSLVADITPILPAVDVLVTDYSSLAYDVGLLAMPVVYLAPDPEEYARSRGFYGRYVDVAGEDSAADWTAAVAQLETTLQDAAEHARRSERSRALSAAMHAHRDGRNAERVHDAILARITGAASASADPTRTPTEGTE
ncbi:CDP-glycerol glycerophosphotransferase family protein [Microbacterium sp. ASV81]|uniref:CDP-glycerol glycerophosphotransferase family protein n=1 Tax=Microbacterium capsulatum TaxID=3041921 RepID=A0ABU0XG97_9MICO|nr:CDP-glycerol glycerophosphotransferase family protein [Microbacterium sp. ASV81]MDQ4214086.1 CDP-glycerol glycerophosphotransferase family protein [Microbacterium sp. ASV81]